MNPRSPTPGPVARKPARGPSRRTTWRGIALAGLILAAGIGIMVALRPSPLPIPVPAQLGSLDPQVREHLARLASRTAKAPADPALRSELGLAFAVNGLWREARQSFLDAIALGETGPLPATYAAVALQEAGQMEAAASELKEVTRRFPGDAPAWHRLGVVLNALGDVAGAASAFQKVTELSPDAWQGWAGLGETLLRQGEAARALAPLTRAVELDPMARSARHGRSQALRAAGREAEANRELAAGRSETVGPLPDEWSLRAVGHMKSIPDQFEQADGLLAQGRVQDAVALLGETWRFHPDHPGVLARLAAALRAGDQTEKAWALLQSALAKSSNDVVLLTAAIHTAAAMGQSGVALELAGRARALAPKSAEVQVAEADAHLAAGEDRMAADALRRAIEWAPRDPGLWLQLGDLQHRNLGQATEAESSYMAALALDPIHPLVIERLARLRIEGGEWAAAERWLGELRSQRADAGLVESVETALREARAARP